MLMEGGLSDDDRDSDSDDDNDDNDNDNDDNDNDDDAKGRGKLGDANVVGKRKTITTRELAAYKGGSKLSLRRVIRRYHTILVKQRTHFETIQPEFAVAVDADGKPPTGMSLEEARRQIDEAYAQMDVHVKALVDSLERVRGAERMLNPSAFAQPAVILLAVSAPSTSWALDEVIHAPFPRISAALKDIFLAGYSNPDKSENRTKRLYVRTKKAVPKTNK